MNYQYYLPLLIPPLLGAVIGYVTNYIAIRMLFRPLRAWRIIGLRVPLTPGIIPAKRGELALKMGEMVGDHLLTAEDVGSAFSKKSIRRELRLAVTDKLASLLDQRLGSPESLVPERFRQRFRELVSLAQTKIVKILVTYLHSQGFEEKFYAFWQQQSREFLSRDLNSFLTPEGYADFKFFLDGKYSKFFQADKTAALVGDFVDRKSEQLLHSDRPLRELLPQDLVDLLLAQLEKELPPLAEKFGSLLYDPDFRLRLVEKGKKAIDGFLDSLGGLAGLLSGFIDLNKVYDKIPGFLDQAGDEIAAWLKEESTQERLTALLRERVDQLLDRSPGAYIEKLPYEKIKGFRLFLRHQVVAAVQSRKTVDTALGLSDHVIDRLKDHSFDDLLHSLMGDRGFDRSHDWLAEQLLKLIRSPRMEEVIEGIIVEQSDEWLYRKPLGLLSTRLPGDLRQELELGTCQLIETLLKKEAPRLVETLNVRRMVEDKVNSLDLLQVEGLLMGVMKEQFKYINLFGALLGFLIGLVNLMLLRLL